MCRRMFFFSSVAKQVYKICVLKNGDQITYAIRNFSHIGLSFYKNGDQIETKKDPKSVSRNFRNF